MRRLVCIWLLGLAACADFDAAVADCVAKGLCVSDASVAGGGSAGGGGASSGGGTAGGGSGGSGGSAGGGSSEMPSLALLPSSLDFGAQPVSTTVTRTTELRNLGGGVATVTGITTPMAFTVDAGGCTTLAADASCTLTVAFRSPVPGNFEGDLLVQEASGFALASLTAIATSSTPSFSLTPAVANFPETELDAGTELPFTVTNTGPVRLGVQAPMVMNGTTNSYALTTNGCADASIDTGQTCTFSVRFQPKAEGRVLGSVSVGVSGGGALAPETSPLDGGGFVRFPLNLVVAVPTNTERDGGAIVEGAYACSGNCTLWARRGQHSFTPVPALTAQFQSWGGDCGGAFPVCALNVHDGGTVVANFGFPNRIFVLRDAGTGDSLRSGFIARCKAEAAAAGLKDVANFDVFTSVGSTPPTQETTYTARLGFLRPDGRPAFFSGSDLTTGAAAHPPLLLADGGPVAEGTLVWTGNATDNCGNWTNTVVNGTAASGQVGNPWVGGPTYADSHKTLCTERQGVYCMEVKFSGPQVQRTTPPIGSRRAFISLASLTGSDLGTIGDTQCQTEATAAGLGGTFVALRRINDSLNVTADGGTWYRTDGVQLVPTAASLFSIRAPLNWLAPLNRTADGGLSATLSVWTGGLDGGTAQNCNNWSGSAGAAIIGNAQTVGPGSLGGTSVQCMASRSFYCFQR